jgi:glycosyltransferase involved in cell wall biosynthesis
MSIARPRILLLVDYTNGSHDIAAQALRETLGDRYEFVIVYGDKSFDVAGLDIHLAIAMFWGDDALARYHIPRSRMVRLIGSHRWIHPFYGQLTDQQFCERYLADSDHILCLSQKLMKQLVPYRGVKHFPYGIYTDRFTPMGKRSGPITFGWAGRLRDDSKGVKDILLPATEGLFELQIADGFSHSQMVDFYAGLDVFCVASVAEGGSTVLIESMSCGLFPVACDVGWVPEVIVHGQNGLIVERTPEAFRSALTYCAQHPDEIRRAGASNVERIRAHWDWRSLRPQLCGVLDEILAATPEGSFRLV